MRLDCCLFMNSQHVKYHPSIFACIATILVFKSKANSVLQIQEIKDEDKADIDGVANSFRK